MAEGMGKPALHATSWALAFTLSVASSAYADGAGQQEATPKHVGPYEDDSGRSTALAAATVTWSLSLLTTSVGFLGSSLSESGNSTPWGTSPAGWLALYDLNMAVTPSIPRWIVGDTKGALLYTSIRGLSVGVASFIPLSNASGGAVLGVATLGFILPVILGVVDLATTPHREDLEGQDQARERKGPRITGIAPAAIEDPNHRLTGGIVRLSAGF
jgi:hypothetical protein